MIAEQPKTKLREIAGTNSLGLLLIHTYQHCSSSCAVKAQPRLNCDRQVSLSKVSLRDCKLLPTL